ncbi:hypothetical protein AAIR98_001468 [Elusimicrobium simillimum]|uniref:hypothetical protein n=1 Tax=Elusimicrobium simillimum TaxID=3143438 RepID=UPI003C6EC882
MRLVEQKFLIERINEVFGDKEYANVVKVARLSPFSAYWLRMKCKAEKVHCSQVGPKYYFTRDQVWANVQCNWCKN